MSATANTGKHTAPPARMSRLRIARFAAVVVGFLIATMAYFGSGDPDRRVASVQGWCCVAGAGSCMNGYTPLNCYNADGFAFDPREEMCKRACALQP